MDVTVRLQLNGVDRTITTDAQRPLLEVLREVFGLTGTKYGCGEGQCRSCLVLVDEEPTVSCLLPVRAVDGKTVKTIEGLAQGGTLHPVQEAFLEEEALQCGYCTSGMIISAAALLRKHPNPSEDEIARKMNGNLCRCNEYVKIIKAVRRASQKAKGRSNG